MNKEQRPRDGSALRRRAEALLRKRQSDSAADDHNADVLKLLHEMQVHQIELELQNAELAQARDEIENGLRRYTELYDFAPVAYLTLDHGLAIRQINLTGASLLGIERSRLIGQPFKRFVALADRSDFTDFAAGILAGHGRETCEIALQRPDSSPAQSWIHVEAVRSESDDGFRAMLLDITEQRRMKEIIWRQANYDSLTLLPNRRLFMDRLRHELQMTQRAGQVLALLFIDLDRFKEINDTFGHDAGDHLLVEAARRMSEGVRSTDTVARLSGDEFAIFLPALTDTTRIGTVASDIGEALARPFVIGEAALQISASIGITLYPLDARDVTGLLRNADRAMYVAKAEGRNRFSYFTPSLQLAAQERLDLIRDLRAALTGGQFMVHFQPIVDLATGRVVRAEALLRWNHPQRGMVAPGEFIAVTDDVGLTGALGDWVFAEAAKWAQRWRGEPGHDIQVSVNVSPLQFVVAGSAARWAGMLADLGLASDRIGIDVTERMLLDASPVVADELRRLHETGIAVAIDGFGTGVSSLPCLANSDIATLKIDRSLIRRMDTDANGGMLVEAIIAICQKFGIRVVAEGIETLEQRDMLRAAGCDFGQGFLFAPPLPPESVWARWSTLVAHDAPRQPPAPPTDGPGC